MAKANKSSAPKSATLTPKKGVNAISKVEIPIPPKALKTGLRIAIDVNEKKVRLQLESLYGWT